jgi:hypothetical protein
VRHDAQTAVNLTQQAMLTALLITPILIVGASSGLLIGLAQASPGAGSDRSFRPQDRRQVAVLVLCLPGRQKMVSTRISHCQYPGRSREAENRN